MAPKKKFSQSSAVCVQNLLKFTGLSRTVAPLLSEIIKYEERLECRGVGMFVKEERRLCFFYV